MAKTILIMLIILLVIWAIYLLVNKGYQLPQTSNNVNGSVAVSIENFAFNPASISVPAGKTVTWTNRDSASHSINSDGFNSGVLNQGQTFSFAANKKGVYNYKCGIHPFMTGKIIVE